MNFNFGSISMLAYDSISSFLEIGEEGSLHFAFKIILTAFREVLYFY